MLRLYDSDYRAVERQLQASRDAHYIDYAIHASILRSEQVKDIPYLKKKGINSLKIYMNLGADLNLIYMDLEPGEHGV
jgi:dihydropyrimidinase